MLIIMEKDQQGLEERGGCHRVTVSCHRLSVIMLKIIITVILLFTVCNIVIFIGS